MRYTKVPLSSKPYRVASTNMSLDIRRYWLVAEDEYIPYYEFERHTQCHVPTMAHTDVDSAPRTVDRHCTYDRTVLNTELSWARTRETQPDSVIKRGGEDQKNGHPSQYASTRTEYSAGERKRGILSDQ